MSSRARIIEGHRLKTVALFSSAAPVVTASGLSVPSLVRFSPNASRHGGTFAPAGVNQSRVKDQGLMAERHAHDRTNADELREASDGALARMVANGSRDAFAELFARHRGAVFRYARYMTGCPATADDLVQDVFVALLDGIDRFDEMRAAFPTYVHGIARNFVLRHQQRRGARRELEMTTLDEETSALIHHEDPIAQLTASDRVDRLRRTILTLPFHQREVLVLCDLHEWSYEEAARLIGCPVGTIRSRLSRARAALSQRLSAREHERAAVCASVARR